MNKMNGSALADNARINVNIENAKKNATIKAVTPIANNTQMNVFMFLVFKLFPSYVFVFVNVLYCYVQMVL